MGTYTIIMTLVIIIGGVLQIILFFKIWGMTNNVKEIKAQIIKPSINISTIKREIKKKNPNIGDMLFDAMWEALESVYLHGNANYWSVITSFKKLYHQAEVPFPEDVEKIKRDSDYKEYSMRD